MVRHDDYLSPASLEKRTDPADQIANFCLNAAGQLPALVVTALVERAGFRPGRPGRVSGFVCAEELPSACFQGGHETILRQKLPRGNQPRGELVACLTTLNSVGDRRSCGLGGSRDRGNGGPLPVLRGFNASRRQFLRQLLGDVHPQSVRKQYEPSSSSFDWLGALGNRPPIVVDELLQVAGGVFEPRQIDGPHGSQHRTVLLRRPARRHGGEGGCVHAPAVAGIKLCIRLRGRSAGGGLAQTGQLRQRFESRRQRA